MLNLWYSLLLGLRIQLSILLRLLKAQSLSFYFYLLSNNIKKKDTKKKYTHAHKKLGLLISVRLDVLTKWSNQNFVLFHFSFASNPMGVKEDCLVELLAMSNFSTRKSSYYQLICCSLNCVGSTSYIPLGSLFDIQSNKREKLNVDKVLDLKEQ